MGLCDTRWTQPAHVLTSTENQDPRKRLPIQSPVLRKPPKLLICHNEDRDMYRAPLRPSRLPLPVTKHARKPRAPASAEVDAVIAVVKGFLAALSTKSPVEFDKYCVRAGGMSLWPPPPMLPRFCTIGAFVEQIARVEDDIDERIWDPEVKVSELGDLAMVWAPFRGKINGVVDHVGVELFILHKFNGQWKVTGLADSCRRPTDKETQMLR
ncbi:hypothetical protein P170DRAFT_349791 [Aspergillus terreus]|uniref:Uncharacterized protein n=1 Tax=Aspergillus terreus TaxID=33178 RepID=A0A5M3Z3A5_ASPTE|nr:hypothetical protein ATETN484_0006048300 [Aspergillus terreus]GFF11927.1 hypothetical protein P170DRAFT_349791 [Aspergillus terreus]